MPLTNQEPPVLSENPRTEILLKQTRDNEGLPVEYESVEVINEDERPEDETDWLQLAQDAYSSSSEWLQADKYAQWERNISNYRSIHPPGSKYHSASYKYRSRMFRPKTRTAVRKVEAGVAAALFSNQDLISVDAQNMADPQQRASADINKELMQERLTNGTVPWFQLCIGATQDAANYGGVISHQYWEYAVDKLGETIFDRPVIELCPPENIRLDRSAKWTDPINDSPYLIHLLPMYIGDVLDRMERDDDKTGQPAWFELTADQLRSASKNDFDGVRAQRHTPETDPKNSARQPADSDFDTVWIHRNFVRKNGEDWVYYTAGTEYMLTDPIPVREAYPHLRRGERPYVMGTLALEAHKVYPDSYVQLGQNLQAIANDIANRRHDNVMMAMDKRFFIRRDANVDRDQLFRTVPGGGIETDDPNSDVKVVDTGDVTGSAYAEQDRINLDYDDLMGQFNQGTNTPGAAGKSVGGMSMAMSDTDGMTDFVIRTLLTTWVKPVMDQFVRLEQNYETDMYLIAVAAQKADVYVKYNVSNITDQMLRETLTLNINVGIGATSPERKLNMLMSGTTALTQIPGVGERLNGEEFIKEVYGAIGYQDGARFVLPQEGPTPQEQQLMQQVEELQRKIDARVTEGMLRIDMERVRQQGQVEERRIQGEYNLALESMKQRIDDMKILIDSEKNDIAKGELEMEMEALEMQRQAMIYQHRADQLNMRLESEKENRQDARDFLKQGQTGSTTQAASRPAPHGEESRVFDSDAGTISRNKYANVPMAEY